MSQIKHAYERYEECLIESHPEDLKEGYHKVQSAYTSLIEMISFASAEEFHEFASEDVNYELPPSIRLFGYRKATLEEPKNIKYQECLLRTLKYYYSHQDDYELQDQVEEQIRLLKEERW